MTISYGSGQTSGLPLVVTAITQAGGQTLHTAIAGAGVPQRIQISAFNLDTLLSHSLTVAIWAASGLAPIATYTIALPRNVGQYAALDPNFISVPPELVLNGASFITVWSDTASKIAVTARINDQSGVATITGGSGQTSGLPLIVTSTFVKGTLPTSNSGQLLHTAPAGTNTANVLTLMGINTDPVLEHAVAVGIFASGATVPTAIYQINLPIGEGVYQILDPKGLTNLVLNGASFIQVWADTASVVGVMVNVNTQVGSAGSGSTVAQTLSSGLIAGVISAGRFGMYQSGGTGQTAEANAQILSPGPGVIKNLCAVSSATMAVGSSVTCVLRQNGVATTQTVTLTSANTTVLATTAGIPVAVAKGDLLTFEVIETLGVAPVANFQVAAELQLTG